MSIADSGLAVVLNLNTEPPTSNSLLANEIVVTAVLADSSTAQCKLPSIMFTVLYTMLLHSSQLIMPSLCCLPPLVVGSDFLLLRPEVTFDVGANDGNFITFVVDILDDFLVEGTETFTLFGNVTTTGISASFVGGPATFTIIDNDGRC